MTIEWFSCSLLFVLKNKEYGAKILKNPDEENIIKKYKYLNKRWM